jgi:hypothetical protein
MAPQKRNELEPLEPLALHEQKESFRDDPVKFTDETAGQGFGKEEEEPDRWLEDKYVPEYPKGGNPADGGPSADWDKAGQ